MENKGTISADGGKGGVGGKGGDGGTIIFNQINNESTKNNICPSCKKGVEKYKEFLPGQTITYFSCGHRNFTVVINESVSINDEITTKVNQDISKDYEELSSFTMKMSKIKTAKMSDDKEGQRFFEGYKEKIFQVICVKAKACEKIKTIDKSDLTSLVQWVSDILTSVSLGFPIPIVTISRIIVKRGIGNFCNCV